MLRNLIKALSLLLVFGMLTGILNTAKYALGETGLYAGPKKEGIIPDVPAPSAGSDKTSPENRDSGAISGGKTAGDTAGATAGKTPTGGTTSNDLLNNPSGASQNTGATSGVNTFTVGLSGCDCADIHYAEAADGGKPKKPATAQNKVLIADIQYPEDKIPVFNNAYADPSGDCEYRGRPRDGAVLEYFGPGEFKGIPLTEPFTTEHVAYVMGYPDGRVGPMRNITRAEAAMIFHRLLTGEVRDYFWMRDNPFPDVHIDMWYNNAISVMYRMGMLNGELDGNFHPDGDITRAEFTSIIARFARLMHKAPERIAGFGDTMGHWAEDDIIYAASINWVDGYPDGTFGPELKITRAEVMTAVNRMLGRIPGYAGALCPDGMNVWTDNSYVGEWYYLAVQEATNSHKNGHTDECVPGLDFNYEYWEAVLNESNNKINGRGDAEE